MKACALLALCFALVGTASGERNLGGAARLAPTPPTVLEAAAAAPAVSKNVSRTVAAANATAPVKDVKAPVKETKAAVTKASVTEPVKETHVKKPKVAALQLDTSVKAASAAASKSAVAAAVVPPKDIKTVKHEKEAGNGYLKGSPLFPKQQEGKIYTIEPAGIPTFQAAKVPESQQAPTTPGFWISALCLLAGIVCLVGVAAWNHNTAKSAQVALKAMPSPQSIRSVPSVQQQQQQQRPVPSMQVGPPMQSQSFGPMPVQSGVLPGGGSYSTPAGQGTFQSMGQPMMQTGPGMMQVPTSPMTSQQQLMMSQPVGQPGFTMPAPGYGYGGPPKYGSSLQ